MQFKKLIRTIVRIIIFTLRRTDIIELDDDINVIQNKILDILFHLITNRWILCRSPSLTMVILRISILGRHWKPIQANNFCVNIFSLILIGWPRQVVAFKIIEVHFSIMKSLVRFYSTDFLSNIILFFQFPAK